MAFKKGPNVLVINDAAQAPLFFYAKTAGGIKKLVETDDDYQTTTAFDKLDTSPDGDVDTEGAGFNPATPATDETIAQADMLKILGFGDFEGADIVEVIGAKGIAGQKQVSTLTFTVNSAVAGQEIVVNLDFTTDDLRGEFATEFSDYKRKKQFIVTVKAGDTPTTIATRLKETFQSIVDSGWQAWVTVSSAVGVVTLTSTDPKITFKASFEGDAVSSGNVAVAFATTTGGYSGRNTYEQLKSLRLETVLGQHVEEFKSKQVPIKGAKYSSYMIRKNVTRHDLAGFSGGINSVPTGTFDFELYVNESLTEYISNLVKWLNANAAKRTMYAGTTANDILAGETVNTETVVDSTEPFGTPLT